MQVLLQGKTAVVTGSNRGIGKAIVENFAKQGARIWACARKPSEEFEEFLATVAEEANVKITPVYFDLDDADGLKAAAKGIVAEKEPIDILVNCAGVIHTALFLMTPTDKMQSMFGTNFFAPMVFTQFLAKAMTRNKRGSIINVSSSAAIEGNDGRAPFGGLAEAQRQPLRSVGRTAPAAHGPPRGSLGEARARRPSRSRDESMRTKLACMCGRTRARRT